MSLDQDIEFENIENILNNKFVKDVILNSWEFVRNKSKFSQRPQKLYDDYKNFLLYGIDTDPEKLVLLNTNDLMIKAFIEMNSKKFDDFYNHIMYSLRNETHLSFKEQVEKAKQLLIDNNLVIKI